MNFNELLAMVAEDDQLSVCIDSRIVKAGDVFVALKGTAFDGHNFIDQAIANGAEYIVTQRKDAKYETIVVENSARAAALLAQANNGNPASQLVNLAVTGTNGKTTVAFLVRAIIQKASQKCGLIGTVVYDTGLDSSDAPLTTPDCLSIARMQRRMVDTRVKYMAIEASSHALDQDRLAAINFQAAAFTNLTGDHLDYHKTEENYLAAKRKLFRELEPEKTAVMNKQSPHAIKLAKNIKAKILWYAIDESADLTAHIESMDIMGTVFTLAYAGQKKKIKTTLLGRYNVSNILAAAGLALAAGFDLKTIADGLEELKTIPGRLEKIDFDSNFSVLIDYAHTDDALKNVLSTLKPLCKASLRVVFGCGGDRDKTKRPRMAAIAEQLADFVIVTSDNPRTEHPAAIIGEIMTGFENPVAMTITSEIDRKKAIDFAIKTAEKDDILLIAGKGHETYQIIGKEKIEFSDKKIALQCLECLENKVQNTK